MNKTAIALGLIAAFVVLIIYSINLSVIQWPAQQAENKHWAEQAKESPKNFLLVCPPSEDGKPIAPEKCERHGQYENDRKNQIADNQAQISMRNATWVTALIAFAGLVLIGFTLVQSFEASNFAREALASTKIATSLEQRAYVDVGDVAYGGSIGGNEVLATFNPIIVNGIASISVTIRIRNSGNMPASNLVLTFRGKANFMGAGVLGGGDYGEFHTSNLGYLGPKSHQDISTNVSSPIYGVATPDANGVVMALITIHTIIIFQDEYGEQTGQALRGIEQRWVGVNVTGKSFTARRANMIAQENDNNA